MFWEVLVIDDGSTDETASIVRRYSGVRLLKNPGNRGKGYSVRHGMLDAKGDWMLLSDADLSTPIEELEKLWETAEKTGAQVIIGSRALNRALIGVHQPWTREYVGRFFNVFMRALTGLPFHDTQCGFKLFERSAARSIFERQLLNGFGFDVEVLLLANQLGYRTVEVPVRWNDVPGTKVSTLLGLDAFADVFRVRWNQWTGKYR